MAKRKHTHTLAAMSCVNLCKLLARYRVSSRQLPQLIWFAGSGMLGVPFRLFDSLTTRKLSFQTEIEQPPVFIVGHWRSGTTHLHNLMSCDPQFGLLSMFHCIAATSFLGPTKVTRWILAGKLPEERPMDAVKLSLDAPQEEELAMARISTLSYNHCYHFPQNSRETFQRCVTFDGPTASADAAAWKKTYSWLLRRLTVDQKGRRLCLKNPPNTARIRQLLELFPNALFIHIHRSPFDVYRSTRKLWERVLPIWALQPYDLDRVEGDIVHFYQSTMRRYLADRSLIPPGQLVDVRFEDLEENPIPELERIYDALSLDGFEQARPEIESYLGSLGEYRKDDYKFDEQILRRVEDAWGFALEEWDYSAQR